MASPREGSLSGLTQSEAQEFHSSFIQGFLIFTVIAIIAHVLVWMWRPWIPGPEGYSSLEGLHHTFSALSSLVA
jgi:light-harvesting complex 1 beta chain